MIRWERGGPVWAEGRARWKQIADEVRQRIVTGVYRSGGPLPSITSFEQEFGVTRNTMRKALRHLGAEGLIQPEPGVGTFVTYGLNEGESEK